MSSNSEVRAWVQRKRDAGCSDQDIANCLMMASNPMYLNFILEVGLEKFSTGDPEEIRGLAQGYYDRVNPERLVLRQNTVLVDVQGFSEKAFGAGVVPEIGVGVQMQGLMSAFDCDVPNIEAWAESVDEVELNPVLEDIERELRVPVPKNCDHGRKVAFAQLITDEALSEFKSGTPLALPEFWSDHPDPLFIEGFGSGVKAVLHGDSTAFHAGLEVADSGFFYVATAKQFLNLRSKGVVTFSTKNPAISEELEIKTRELGGFLFFDTEKNDGPCLGSLPAFFRRNYGVLKSAPGRAYYLAKDRRGDTIAWLKNNGIIAGKNQSSPSKSFAATSAKIAVRDRPKHKTPPRVSAVSWNDRMEQDYEWVGKILEEHMSPSAFFTEFAEFDRSVIDPIYFRTMNPTTRGYKRFYAKFPIEGADTEQAYHIAASMFPQSIECQRGLALYTFCRGTSGLEYRNGKIYRR